jgi:hypothetical protein
MSVIPQTPRASGGLGPLGSLLGLCPGPTGDRMRSPDPSPTHAPPNHKSWIRPWIRNPNWSTSGMRVTLSYLVYSLKDDPDFFKEASSYSQLSPHKVMSRSNLHFLYNYNLIIYNDWAF